jgi:MATE domain protein
MANKNYYSIAKNTIKELNKFSIPLIINSFFNIGISSILSAIIGRISMVALASTEVVDSFLYAFVGILGVGTLAFNISASKIKSNKSEFFDWFKSIFELNFIIGSSGVVFIIFSSKKILSFLYNFNGIELSIGSFYANIQSLLILFNMMIFSMGNLLKVNKKTKEILYIGIISSILQLVLSYYFVYFIFEAEYRIIGISLASVISLGFEVASYIFILRKDFFYIIKIKSTKKIKILKNSILLVFQELLEGSVFQILIVSMISQLGLLTISSYSVAMKIFGISVLPMYIYCNALTVFIGESIEKTDIYKLKILPILTTSITTLFFLIVFFVMILNKSIFIKFYTNIDNVILDTEKILIFTLLFSWTQVLFENTKYSLQALEKANIVLKITGIVNTFTIIILITIRYFYTISLFIILLVLSLNYILLSILFYYNYYIEINYIQEKL